MIENLLRPRNQSYLLSFLIVAIGYYISTTIGVYGFWHDELYTLGFVQGFDMYLFAGSDLLPNEVNTAFGYKSLLSTNHFWDNLSRNLIHEGHPPLYYLLLEIWSQFFGLDEVGLRSFSSVTACVSLVVVFRMGALVSKKYAIVLPVLLGLSPTFLYYAVEARSYSMYTLSALLTLYYGLKILRAKKAMEQKHWRDLIMFVIFGTILSYTHYYGVFFFFVLALFVSIRFFTLKQIPSVAILMLPGLFFVPWLEMIKLQTEVHAIHWTDGYLGFVASVGAYFDGMGSLMVAPIDYSTTVEKYLIFGIMIVLASYLSFVSNQSRRQLLFTALSIAMYGGLIIVFDYFIDHHTISVPRYYLPLHGLLLFCFYYMTIQFKSVLLKSVIFISFAALIISVQIDFNNGLRGQKQMYREAAAYISSNYNPEVTKLIISPSGPSTIGIAYYLSEDYEMHSVMPGEVCAYYEQQGYVVIEQRLGILDEPWAQGCAVTIPKSRRVQFVGLDIINAK